MAELENFGQVTVRVDEAFNGSAKRMPVQDALDFIERVSNEIEKQDTGALGYSALGDKLGPNGYYQMELRGDTKKIENALRNIFAEASAGGKVVLSESVTNPQYTGSLVAKDISLKMNTAPKNILG